MTMLKLRADEISNRKNGYFHLAKNLGIIGYKYLTKSHAEISEKIFEVKNEKSIFIYVPLHKSLWETTGIMVPLHLNGICIPYAGMGDNLIRGDIFRKLAHKVGVFLVKRPVTRSQMLESARMLKDYTISHIAYGLNVLIFPEGTRKGIPNHGHYGNFFPTVFEAMLEYEKTKNEIVKCYPELIEYETYIIPTNVDYSKVREDREMIADYKGKPRTLRIWDSMKMLKNIGDTYISYGDPLKVSDFLHMDRKELASLIRQKCLNLVKILPINIVSWGIVNSVGEDQIHISKIQDNMAQILKKLSHLEDRFRGINPGDHPAKILALVAKKEPLFREKNISIKNLNFYRLYANYIRHYLEEPQSNVNE